MIVLKVQEDQVWDNDGNKLAAQEEKNKYLSPWKEKKVSKSHRSKKYS